jgi:group I intron endonuclease
MSGDSRKSMISGIYLITNRTNGKIYVGSAKNFRMRWGAHRSQLRTGSHHSAPLQQDWKIYGEEVFDFSILEGCELAQLIEREQAWLNDFQPFGDRGYNLCPRAESHYGYKLRDEGCQNIAAGVSKHYEIEAHRQRQAEIAKKKWSDPEYRKLMSDAAKDRHFQNPQQLKQARAKRKDYSMMGNIRSFVKTVRGKQAWTPKQDQVLRDRYAADGSQVCATALTRSVAAVRQRASQLRLKKGAGATVIYRQVALAREASKRNGNT